MAQCSTNPVKSGQSFARLFHHALNIVWKMKKKSSKSKATANEIFKTSWLSKIDLA